MTPEEARSVIDSRGDDTTAMFGRRSGDDPLTFDYLKGRVMKVSLTGPLMRTDLYNRDNGDGAAELVIAQLRKAARTEASHAKA